MRDSRGLRLQRERYAAALVQIFLAASSVKIHLIRHASYANALPPSGFAAVQSSLLLYSTCLAAFSVYSASDTPLFLSLIPI